MLQEGEMDPMFVFIMNHGNCHAALGVAGALIAVHQDLHMSAKQLVRYIVQEMAALANFPPMEKHLIRRITGPPSEYDNWCMHSLTVRQAKVFEEHLEEYFTTGP